MQQTHAFWIQAMLGAPAGHKVRVGIHIHKALPHKVMTQKMTDGKWRLSKKATKNSNYK